jgi:hypothetical protein
LLCIHQSVKHSNRLVSNQRRLPGRTSLGASSPRQGRPAAGRRPASARWRANRVCAPAQSEEQHLHSLAEVQKVIILFIRHAACDRRAPTAPTVSASIKPARTGMKLQSRRSSARVTYLYTGHPESHPNEVRMPPLHLQPVGTPALCRESTAACRPVACTVLEGGPRGIPRHAASGRSPSPRGEPARGACAPGPGDLSRHHEAAVVRLGGTSWQLYTVDVTPAPRNDMI